MPNTTPRPLAERRALAAALLERSALADTNDTARIDAIAQASSRALLESACGSARAARTLLAAPDAAWDEYIDYVAGERPTFTVGAEGREAARALSRDAARIYAAVGQSNMVVLNEDALTRLVEATADADAKRVARVIAQIGAGHRRSSESGLVAYFAQHGSPL